MNPQAVSHRERLRHTLLITAQVVLLALIWLSADFISRHYVPQIPSSLLGMGSVLTLLALRLLRRDWLAHGAGWLIGEMLLFFVPAVIAIIQYPDMIRHNGLAILVVILGSTICVMVATAIAVDLTWRLQEKLGATPKEKQS